VLSPAKDIANDSLLVLSDRVLSPQQGERFLLELADALPDQLLDMKERDFELRRTRAKEEAAAEETRKAEREAEAKAMREVVRQKAEAARQVEIKRSKQIKKDMAEAAAKERQDAEAKAKVR